jgi:hypothetical protein
MIKEAYTSNANDAQGRGCPWIQGNVCGVADNVENAADENENRVKYNPRFREPLQAECHDPQRQLGCIAHEQGTLDNIEKELRAAV